MSKNIEIKKKVIAITGPSASGKTSLAVKLAKEINGEIISVDSRQIYKELDIGSAKPNKIEQQGIKHYLIDILDINEEYSVANFCDDAKICIDNIINKGKIPILAGGTGLYFRTLLEDFDLPRVPPNKNLREQLNKLSSNELYSTLSNFDFEIAQKIHPNNKVKIIRALEVCMTLNKKMSNVQKKKQSEFYTLWIGLNSSDREFLYNRINLRVDEMFEKGLLIEAENLFEKYGENKILMNTIGYQEISQYLKRIINLEDTKNLLKQNTRRYAKRQITWFNRNKNINWFDIKTYSSDKILENILKINNFLLL